MTKTGLRLGQASGLAVREACLQQVVAVRQ
jgi:hypothetical protein